MTTEPAPIRRSDLPPTRPPESEIFTWFPLPDGGGDMVRGQRQRGVQVRLRVTYGDWEPVRPDRWADEPAGEEASTAADVDQPTLPALLARLEAERAKSERNAPLCRGDEARWVNEGMEAAHRIDIAHTIKVFWGLEAVVAYQRDGVLPQGDAAFVPPPPGSTAEQLPDDILALIDPPPYLSTACETAQLLEQAMAEHPGRQAGLGEWARRMHDRCRINQKFTGKLCTCAHHGPA